MHCSSLSPAYSGGGCNEASYPSYSQSYSSSTYAKSSYSFSTTTTNGGVTESSVLQSSTVYSEQQSVKASDIDGFKVFESALQRTYDFLATRNSVEVVGGPEEPTSADTVANNILGFIEQRLQRDLAEGASVEELEQRLNEGLEGFEKGFAEAKEQIEALGWLNNSVEGAIGKTYELVTAGVEALRAEYITGVSQSGGSQVGSAQNETLAETTAVEESINESVVKHNIMSALNSHRANEDHTPTINPSLSAGYGHYNYGQLNSFTFELETADGDKVTIHASTRDAYAAEYRFGSFDNGKQAGEFESFDSQSFSSSRFNIEIEGHLDEDELLAIDALMAKVEDLSVDFFEGNLEQAYQQALGMGYNTEEIIGFSLNLRQVEVERFTAAYQEIAPKEQGPANAMAHQLQPLGQFVEGLLETVESASKFTGGIQLLNSLADQIDTAKANQKSSIAEGLTDDKKVADESIGDSVADENVLAEYKENFVFDESQGFSPFIQELLEGLSQRDSLYS